MRFKKLNAKKVEADLDRLIRRLKMGDRLSVTWVKDFTYNFSAPDSKISEQYFGRLFKLLPEDINKKDFDEALRVFNDAWNVFPQKVLGGISPQDKLMAEFKKEKQEELKKTKNLLESPYTDNQAKKLIKEHFARAEKDLDQYLDWAYEEVLPNYEKSLKRLNLSKKAGSESVGVAGVFLEICGQLGMLDFHRLPPNFIADFPDMFERTVVGPKISKTKVATYLKNFLSFLETFYGLNFDHIYRRDQ